MTGPRFARPGGKVPWVVWALTIVFEMISLGMVFATRSDSPAYEFWFESAFIVPVFATVGAVILTRRPAHPIGRLFSAVGVWCVVQFFCGQYATVSLHAPEEPLPGGDIAAWLSDLAQMSVVLTLLFIVLLFPTGRLVSDRWKPLAALTWLTAGSVLLGVAFSPGPLSNWPSIDNPLGLETLVLEALVFAGGPLGLVCFVAALVSLIVRFSRSSRDERLQLKWVAWAAAVGFTLILGSVFGSEDFNDRFGSFVWMVGILGLPVSCAIAVLKYRLYDIDRIISRTLTYGALTGLLVGGYLLAVLALQSVLPVSDDSPLIVATSTLAVIAAFGPLRTRVRRLIDRRFNRTRYNAERTVVDFSVRLRTQTDLDLLTGQLIGVVSNTMQPKHVSLWLKDVVR
ncbi:hypothetical protein BH20ACT23_BH20ACT23_25720 [soil metagenome]